MTVENERQRHTVAVKLRLAPEVAERLKKLAAQKKLSVSALVTQLLTR